MKINDLGPAYGARTTKRRVGRGIGSGLGKTSGKGAKGQKARSGGKIRRGFEGGQTPLYRRIPKRGFTNHFAKEYALVNISDLEKFDNDSVVDLKVLIEKRIIKDELSGLKILGNGNLTKKLTVVASKFSKSAQEKIEAVGGKIEVK